jgi:hypothetical protein
MITTQKSVLQGQAGKCLQTLRAKMRSVRVIKLLLHAILYVAASFPGYATIPTTTNQTLVISQLGVISNQPSILPAHSANTGAAKPTDMQKVQFAALSQIPNIFPFISRPLSFHLISHFTILDKTHYRMEWKYIIPLNMVCTLS